MRERDGQWLFALKANRPLVLAEVKRFLADPATLVERHTTTDADHGRIEVRRHTVSHDVAWLLFDRRYPNEPARDAPTGDLGGVSVDLATAVAGHLGVQLDLVPYANPARYAESLAREIPWDVGFAARDLARGEFLDFSPNFMEVDNVFLVPAGSRLIRASEVDQRGIRVAAPQGSAPDLFLTRTLRNAEVVRVPGGADQAMEALASGRADAYGENAHLLHGVMERLPTGARILDGRFNVVQMAVAVPKGRDQAGMDHLVRFMAQAKREGIVARAIERAGLRGVHVAPD